MSSVLFCVSPDFPFFWIDLNNNLHPCGSVLDQLSHWSRRPGTDNLTRTEDDTLQYRWCLSYFFRCHLFHETAQEGQRRTRRTGEGACWHSVRFVAMERQDHVTMDDSIQFSSRLRYREERKDRHLCRQPKRSKKKPLGSLKGTRLKHRQD